MWFPIVGDAKVSQNTWVCIPWDCPQIFFQTDIPGVPPTTARKWSVLNKIVVLEGPVFEACRNWNSGRLAGCLAHVPRSCESVVKYVVPYRRRRESVVKYVVPYRRGLESFVKYMVPIVGDAKV